MTTFISLLTFTKVGIENIKESPTRLDNARRAFQAFGGELQAFSLVMGQYDAVVMLSTGRWMRAPCVQGLVPGIRIRH